ncbi:PTS system permease (IIAMan), nitrogen regulatory IIA protein [hydrothermal vent metagenome]|uniref:PTS system permease (IIAMan), nitrogen regulatory IIA protein n=1 Tax=hydrothermal vent metagenome TaxID=652676 RepID=A0A3B0R2N8_9ZZZZ
MIGLVVVTHGHLADEFVKALEHVVGPQPQMLAICIGADDDLENRGRDIKNAVQEVDTGDGVILLTDMFGGTPSNLALKLLAKDQVEVLAGVNLPMLIKLAEARTTTGLNEACEIAVAAGRKYIAIASEVLGNRT